MANFGTYNFEDVFRNDTVPEREFTVTKTVDVVTNPLDLTGVSIRASFVSAVNRLVLVTEGESPGISITDATGGKFKINPFSLNQIGTYNYDIQFTFDDGSVRTWIKGTITVLQDFA